MEHFNEIYFLYRELVLQLCFRYLNDQQEAEEATQDVFLTVYKKLSSFRREASTKTWIYRISVNHCLDRIKARQRKKRIATLSMGLFYGDLIIPSKQPTPEEVLLSNESASFILHTIDTLPAQQKMALLLKIGEQLSHKEIAEIMQISTKAVESLIGRARKNLEKKLKQTKGYPKNIV